MDITFLCKYEWLFYVKLDIHIIGATIYPTEERMVLITSNGRLLSMQVDLSTEQLKNSGNILNDDGDRSVGKKFIKFLSYIAFFVTLIAQNYMKRVVLASTLRRSLQWWLWSPPLDTYLEYLNLLKVSYLFSQNK